MEKWKEVYKNKIPKDEYEILVQNGEEKGLIIELISSKYNVSINFGVVSGLRMLDEGIVLNFLFDDEQLDVFRDKEFSNTIYQIEDGEFDEFTKQISGGLYEYLGLKHYVIISLNYIVEVITEWEPEIQINENKAPCVERI